MGKQVVKIDMKKVKPGDVFAVKSTIIQMRTSLTELEKTMDTFSRRGAQGSDVGIGALDYMTDLMVEIEAGLKLLKKNEAQLQNTLRRAFT